MLIFEWVLGMLLGAVLLATLAQRIKVPYPVLLALGGAAIALVPGAPDLELDPALALALFVAPVLLDSAFDTSLRDLRQAWFTVGVLVVGAVVLTTAAVAVVAHAMLPELPWAAAIALGAIVAPPDAAAATAVLRQVRLPMRLMTILEGESLLNDATALLIYRVAVGAAVAGGLSTGSVLSAGLFVVPGGILLGAIAAPIYQRLVRGINDAPMSILLQFIGTFGLWLLAEHLHVSAILAVVTYGIVLGRSTATMPARLRVPSFAVWETIVFVLNVLAFVIVGMQLRPILGRLSSEQRSEYLLIAGAVLVTVIVARIALVMPYNALYRWYHRTYGLSHVAILYRPTAATGSVPAWCGMRGIVTLAAALALPADFPFRDLITLCAFAVVLGTLLIQGLTLRPLLAALKLKADDAFDREVNLARCAALKAGIAALDNDASPAAVALRTEFQETIRQANEDPLHWLPANLAGDSVRRHAIAACRTSLMQLRADGKIGDVAYHAVEEEFDRKELAAGERET